MNPKQTILIVLHSKNGLMDKIQYLEATSSSFEVPLLVKLILELKQTEIRQRSRSTMEQQKRSASIVLKGIVKPPAPTSSTHSC